MPQEACGGQVRWCPGVRRGWLVGIALEDESITDEGMNWWSLFSKIYFIFPAGGGFQVEGEMKCEIK